MSTDVKLLPLPEHMKAWARSLADDAQAYARANMEPLLAENERLRAKYQRAAESSEHFAARAERLAEALQKLAAHVRPTCSVLWEEARAALRDHDQEARNG